jgi:hypothetical protein
MHSFVSAHKEDRYIIPILPIYFLIAVQGIFLTAKAIIKSTLLKDLAVLAVCLIIIYQSMSLSYGSIMFKSESYLQVKDAVLFLKDYLPKDDIIIGNTPQIVYYAQRGMVGFPQTSEQLYELLENNTKINTIVISLFEGMPEYVEEFNNPEKFRIINVGMLENQSLAYTISYLR